MSDAHSLIQRLAALIYVVADAYILALWSLGLVRTGLSFFWVLVVAAAIFFAASLVNLVFAFDPTVLQRVLGEDMAGSVYTAFVAVNPIGVLVAIVGHTMIVRYVMRSAGASTPKA